MQRQLCRQVRVTQERAEERELHDLQLHRAALEERLQQQALGLSELRSEASAGAGATAADTGERHSGERATAADTGERHSRESRSPASLAACSAELLRLVARKQSDLAQGAAERSQLESEAQQRAEQLAELELELDRQERRLQRLAAQRHQQEAQAEAVQSCEARIASLSEQSVRAEACRSQDLQHSQGNSVANDLAVALRELGFDDVARLPSSTGGSSIGTSLLLQASMLDAAARSLRGELEALAQQVAQVPSDRVQARGRWPLPQPASSARALATDVGAALGCLGEGWLTLFRPVLLPMPTVGSIRLAHCCC
ncbi:unnamed protein product [Polarella glacialis]|uniref:Uncharacterized protein n=1 Tax=Polarella glacialis TaxID=89957 RepID=A0A813E3D8_POLGL|nr:unnamed protein product [Polarella glacialis]